MFEKGESSKPAPGNQLSANASKFGILEGLENDNDQPMEYEEQPTAVVRNKPP